MSTNLEYWERQRQRKRESRRQASVAQRQKERQRARTEIKIEEDEFLWNNNMKIFLPVVRKWEMLASSGQQGENERQRKKKRTGTQETTVNKCTKKCAVRAKLLFVCLFLFFAVLVADAVEHYTVIFFVCVNYKYINGSFAFSPGY